MFGLFEFYFALLYIYSALNTSSLFGAGFSYTKKHGEGQPSSAPFNIPSICDRVPQFINFSLDFFRVDGAVHISQHHPLASNLPQSIGAEILAFLGQDP
jgi:hypothetical protein